MAYTDIDKPEDYFNTKLYTGNGSTLNVTGLDFQPDFSWLKCRGVAYHHRLYDVIRTPLDSLRSDSTAAESADGDGLSAFNSDGFTVTQGGNTEYNNNAVAYASWNWLAGGTASSNTDGSITSSVSANTTSGFSIVSYTGTGSNATVGHSLGVAPSMMIFKNRDRGDYGWRVYHKSLGATKNLNLQTTGASETSSSRFNNTEPTSSVFSIGTDLALNTSSQNIIAYCFADTGNKFFKAGSYTGNGNADGTFVYTGFKPAWVLIKQSSGSNTWCLFDNKRGVNGGMLQIHPNTSATDSSANDYIDFLSNGFKCRNTATDKNDTGQSYIYMAFAENPFTTSTGVPACAR